ncbi:DUF4129 domain-containing protein [Cellulosimicrobium cellulans]|uniref:DUF4129 domain-containing protein n=1 Tax=Cellulosimicrobium cellulans TaxID=1710 RepID=UPI000D3612AC|nr:DUF4129 domain-containing protein [Sphaerisporangium cinnabarinum]MCR1982156.1 DUF4129 domain-containing protein [Cellulosimicrobium cellulans]PTU55983.1 hypothetical protein DBB34_11375 [Sphaerisporangium cinnabarinum]
MTTTQGDHDHRRPGPARFTAVAALALAAVLAAATAAPWSWTAPAWLSALARDPTGPPPENVPQEAPTAPRELEIPVDATGMSFDTYLLWFLGAAVLVVLVLLARRYLPRLLVRRRHRDLLLAPPGDTAHLAQDQVVPELRDAVHRVRTQLRTPDADPHDAVVAAWVALERAAARAGTRRDPAQTPTEFTTAVLTSTPADPHAVATLRRLYHHARFGEHTLGTADLDAARHALTRIATDLGTPPDPTPDTPTPADHRARP